MTFTEQEEAEGETTEGMDYTVFPSGIGAGR